MLKVEETHYHSWQIYLSSYLYVYQWHHDSPSHLDSNLKFVFNCFPLPPHPTYYEVIFTLPPKTPSHPFFLFSSSLHQPRSGVCPSSCGVYMHLFNLCHLESTQLDHCNHTPASVCLSQILISLD